MPFRVKLVGFLLVGVGWMFPACRPRGEGHRFPVLVTVSKSGWEVDVPACEGDRILRFELSGSGGEISNRWLEPVGDSPRRIIRIRVNRETLRTGEFSPGEMKLSERRGNVESPFGLWVVVTTQRALGQFKVPTHDAEGSEVFLVTKLPKEGAPRATTAAAGAQVLASWCDGRGDN